MGGIFSGELKHNDMEAGDSPESTLVTCNIGYMTTPSGCKKIELGKPVVPADNEFFDILQKYILREVGLRSRTKQECEYLGGEYTTAGSSKIDPRTGQTDVTSGRCQTPVFTSEDRRIIQQGLCGRKVKSDAEFCKNPI